MANSGQPDAKIRDLLPNSFRNSWYPIALSTELKANDTAPFHSHILGEPIILFRDKDNVAHCLCDKCPHRSAPLSIGSVVEGNIECKYHGWQFNGGGECTRIPALLSTKKIPSAAKVSTYSCVEQQGYVWIWPVADVEADPSSIPFETDKFKSTGPEASGWIYHDTAIDLDIDHSLMLENLLDPAHIPFAHDGTIGRRKDAVGLEMKVNVLRDKITGLMKPESKERDILFEFRPPCNSRFQADLGIGEMHQIHYCVPTKPGEMRLFARIYYNFFLWQIWIPGWSMFNRWFSDKIIFQDYELLHGQSRRIAEGARLWNRPIQVDTLPVMYRQWHTLAMKTKPWFKGFNGDIEDLATFNMIHDSECNALNKQVANAAAKYGFGEGFDPKKHNGSGRGTTLAIGMAMLAMALFVVTRTS